MGQFILDHFPLLFEFPHHSIIAFHEFLGKSLLILNSLFLDHEVFITICQLIDVFAYCIQFDGRAGRRFGVAKEFLCKILFNICFNGLEFRFI